MNKLPAILLLCATVATAAGKPNILVILSNDQGYADAGFQGSKEVPTPHLDELAKSGLRCTSGYVTHQYCSPSRAALLTGRYLTREKTGTPHQQLCWREEEMGQWGARDGALKLVRRTRARAGQPPALVPLPQPSLELFDLARDLRENQNLAASKTGELQRMNTMLDDWCKHAAPLAFTGIRGKEVPDANVPNREGPPANEGKATTK